MFIVSSGPYKCAFCTKGSTFSFAKDFIRLKQCSVCKGENYIISDEADMRHKAKFKERDLEIEHNPLKGEIIENI